MTLRLAFSAIALGLTGLPAIAEIAYVRGGEHDDFTRIVVEVPALGEWSFGRGNDGYELILSDAVSGFDLSRAFDKIPKTRLADLTLSDQARALMFNVPCACYAVAFAVNDGLVAIDIRNGAPSAGSPFEAPLRATLPDLNSEADENHVTSAPETGVDLALPALSAAPGYNWLELAGLSPSTPAPDGQDIDETAVDQSEARLGPMRDALLRQISRGIAGGVIDPGSPARPPDPAMPGSLPPETPGFRVVNGELPGLRARAAHSPGPNLTISGAPCLSDRQADVSGWAEDETMAAARAALLAEFDAPLSENILNAAKFHIATGFGAEARQILILLPPAELAQYQALTDLSYLVDLEPPSGDAFAGMESCETQAALWAVLAIALAEEVVPVASANTAAISRNFSQLSLQMRRHLGPTLAGYFMAVGDETTARRLQDATLRAPGAKGQDVQLMKAGIELATGSSSQAAAIADEVMDDPGNSAAAASILVTEAAFAGNRQVPPELASQLSALSAELRDSPDYSRIRRAEILALAMSGEFGSAFDLLPATPDAAPDLWTLAADGAPDDLLLTEALRLSDTPTTDRTVIEIVAQRLFDHGFAQEALLWLGPPAALSTESERLLAADAALAMRDGRLAIRALAGISGERADGLRARAALQLGNADSAAALLRASGQQNAALRAEFWAGDWDYIASSDAAGISSAAGLLQPSTEEALDRSGNEGVLARGDRLATESEAARDAIENLLQAVPQQFQ